MKKLVFGLAAVMMCVSLAGCGGKAVDINELASALSSDGKFAEQLTEVSSDIAEKRYMISDGEVEECVSYTGTPAVVDEITIFKTSDTESVKESLLFYRLIPQKHCHIRFNRISNHIANLQSNAIRII